MPTRNGTTAHSPMSSRRNQGRSIRAAAISSSEKYSAVDAPVWPLG